MNETFCTEIYQNLTHVQNKRYCHAVFDGFLCWPPTEAGLKINQSCPHRKEMNTSQIATRICGIDGNWLSSNYTKNASKGYTNFDNCLPPHALELLTMCREIDTDKCLQIIHRSRIIEMVGLTLSMISLIMSLFIFYRYRILRNNRTKIHKNLFIATTMQVIIRLIIYIDQSLDPKLIGDTEYLCEVCIILLEYAKTAMFMWMFIEGLYLHNVITVTIFQEYSYIKLYFYIGWGFPFIMTTVWALVMAFAVVNTGCWFLYNLLPQYWILEGPRYTVIIVNMLFLLNIIRVLVLKLRQSRTSEIEQVRKAVRAAVFLLPLMGIANILFIADYKLFKKAWKFALWLYVSYFLTTFQGFFVAVLYCFLNEESQFSPNNCTQLILFGCLVICDFYFSRTQNLSKLAQLKVDECGYRSIVKNQLKPCLRKNVQMLHITLGLIVNFFSIDISLLFLTKAFLAYLYTGCAIYLAMTETWERNACSARLRQVFKDQGMTYDPRNARTWLLMKLMAK